MNAADIINIASVIVSGILVIIILGYFITVTIDVTKNVNEKEYLKANPHMFYKDSINCKSFDYVKENNINDIYHIYFRQNIIVKLMFMIINIVVLLLTCMLIIVLISASFCKDEDNTNIRGTIITPYTIVFIYVLLLFICVAFSQYYLYSFYFKKTTLDAIQKNVDNMNTLSMFIYNNITTNTKFLRSLVEDDIDECVKIIKEQFGSDNIIGISKMIFTHSLYNSYKRSKNDKDFNDVKNIFTIQEIKKGTLNAAYYLQYNLKNIESTADDIIKLLIEADACGNNIANIDRKITNVNKTVTSMMDNINEMIQEYMPVKQSIESVHTYLYYEFAIAMSYTTLFIILPPVIYYFMNKNNNFPQFTVSTFDLRSKVGILPPSWERAPVNSRQKKYLVKEGLPVD